MKKAPADRKFNAFVKDLILGHPHTPVIFFIDTDNVVREQVYPHDLANGASQVEARLRAEGELKAVVYAGLPHKEDRHHIRCEIWYLPDQRIYPLDIDWKAAWGTPRSASLGLPNYKKGGPEKT